MISMKSICDWAGSNPSQRKFIEGERVYKAGHIIKCGKSEQLQNGYTMTFTAVCLQTSNLRDNPHEINGQVSSDGKILNCSCSCKAGLGEKCKHIIAALLYCYQKGDALETLSCTYKKCEWKKVHKTALDNYNPARLLQHSCFTEGVKNHKLINAKVGRHEPIVSKETSKITEAEKETIKAIFEYQYNELMETISNLRVDVVNDCCLTTLNQLSANLQDVCEKTKDVYTHWMRERHSRIAGSICYALYTYTQSNRSDNEWSKKFINTYAPKDFKSDILEHARVTEDEARNAFRNIINAEIVEVGLVISKLNPWLAYSPDEVLMKNKKPVALLEIKCPIVGKTADISATVNSQMKKCLYYGQVQMGMDVLNLNLTYFVIYASFDKKLFYLRVQRDNVFIAKMLMALKKVYFKYKLHVICFEKGNCDKIEAGQAA
ncbi:hypothetical protein TSAR_014568 [Trichomalopsis sarcophagae]|uniref:SWIM-type domain-containing protein n=1 Tax=Trichomalopsis sarcophagae TaxID=543379 RepID=A0A232ERU7_9HYME|nr:hypothetical protein TSAR_014568 [Trichomalopsis sarcophagae]